MNANQFLQTARTVTFLIQKRKADIPDCENWFDTHWRRPWGTDPRMVWSVDSRNAIEKVGDLEMHSVLDATLIAGYLESADIRIEVPREELLGANVHRLVSLAKEKLPNYIADNSMIRIERRWVANTLPKWELLSALAYIFARHFEVCRKLAEYLRTPFPSGITLPNSFDSSGNEARQVHYVMVRDGAVGQITTRSIPQDLSTFKPPAEFRDFFKNRAAKGPPQSLEELIEYHCGMAEMTFRVHGNHLPMLFLYNAAFRAIDYVTATFDERRDKYMFWRSIANRVLILKPKVLIWVCEAWIRHKPFDENLSEEENLRNMGNIDDIPITGEFLGMDVVTDAGEIHEYHWDIERDKATGEVSLGSREYSLVTAEAAPTYLAPILRALEMLRNDRKQ